MTLRPLATRVPREIEQEIREVTDYMDVEKAQAVRIILEIGISEWKKRTALELLRDGKVTFAKAAKFAKLDLWEFADIVRDRKIEWVKIPTGELDEEVRKAVKDTDG
jgi:predicted HTH domain antitoxin